MRKRAEARAMALPQEGAGTGTALLDVYDGQNVGAKNSDGQGRFVEEMGPRTVNEMDGQRINELDGTRRGQSPLPNTT